MNVVLAVAWQVVVDVKRDLLHVDTAGKQVGGDEHTGGTRAELAHNHIAASLVHVAVHRRDREVLLPHLLCQPLDIAAGVAEDDCLHSCTSKRLNSCFHSRESNLCDDQRLVEVAEGVELPSSLSTEM